MSPFGYQDFGIPPQGDPSTGSPRDGLTLFAPTFDDSIVEVDAYNSGAGSAISYDNTVAAKGKASLKLVTGTASGNYAGFLRKVQNPMAPAYNGPNAYVGPFSPSPHHQRPNAYVGPFSPSPHYQRLAFKFRSTPSNASGLQWIQVYVSNTLSSVYANNNPYINWGLQIARQNASAGANSNIQIWKNGSYQYGNASYSKAPGLLLLSVADAANNDMWHQVIVRVDLRTLLYDYIDVDGVHSLFTDYPDKIDNTVNNPSDYNTYTRVHLLWQTNAASSVTGWVDDFSFSMEL